MDARMKILYIASGTKMSGGATKSFIAMLRQAKKAGIRYEVVCPDEFGLTKYLRDIGETVHVVHYRHACLPPTWGVANKAKWLPRLIHNSWINLKAIPKVTEIARNMRADLIHENSSVMNVGYNVAKSLGIPDIIHIREYGDLDFKMKLPGRRGRLADPNTFTISITKNIAKHLNQESLKSATQIYNGVIRRDALKYDPEKENYFLYAGRIEPAKGVSELIAAYVDYARTTENPFSLIIAGGTNYPDYLESERAKVNSSGFSDCVKWLGNCDDLTPLMSKATATIVPSRFEALGRVMPEAMACGCLCIGRYTGGTKEQIDNGRDLTGDDIAIPYDDTGQLTEILTEVTRTARTSSPFEVGGIYHAAIMRSQRSVAEFFSEDRFGERLMDFYKFVMTAHNSKK